MKLIPKHLSQYVPHSRSVVVNMLHCKTGQVWVNVTWIFAIGYIIISMPPFFIISSRYITTYINTSSYRINRFVGSVWIDIR